MLQNYEYYPLTHPQKGIWYTEKLYPDTSIGIIAATLKVEDSFDFGLLEKSINIVIQKNDALRLRFIENQGEPSQYLTEYKYENIDFFDFSENSISALYDWDTKQTQTPFNLIDSKMYYFAILRISKSEFGIYSRTSHLISDGWSIVHVGNQIVDYYYKLKNNEDIGQDNNKSYIDYIEEEQQYQSSMRFIKDRDYWDSQFSSLEEISMFKNSSASHDLRARRKTFIIPNKFSTLIRKYCKDNNTSIFSLFMPALCIYINRITTKEDIIIGVPVLNRTNAKEKHTVGMFVSTVPLRVKINENTNFHELSQEVTNIWYSALRHQRYPYENIFKKVREKNKSAERLYDISLSYQNAKFVKNDLRKQEGRWHFNGYQTESLYIHINDREDDGNIILDFDYDCNLFKAKEIEFIYDHISRLLWHALDNPYKKIPSIEMISEKEKHKILYEFNNTYAGYPKEKTIDQLFEEQVTRTPDNIALVFEDKNMTYAELNNRSNQLARRLQEFGVKPDNIVGIMVKRSFEMMISILAVLKAGGAYLPIDPEYPVNRINYMLEDSKTSILLTDGSHKQINDSIKNKINVFEKLDEDSCCFKSKSTPNNMAYLIYTSGSTGEPKGVAVEHKSVINFITGIAKIININSTKTIASFTTICFDIFVLETILPLTMGSKVIIANENEQKLPQLISNLLIKNKVNIIQMTPSKLKIFLNGIERNNYFNHLSDILIGGEPFPKTIYAQLNSIAKANIYNMYGPTETTVWSTVKKVEDDNAINIGKPIVNTQVYILDKQLIPVPIGIPGEMYIGGEGLSRGYYYRPDLTNNRFIKNPFNNEERIYNTGDLARWFPQGEIEHLGRIDSQIKINGFRIELGEIEQRLLQYKQIKEAVVLNETNTSGNNYLCAYYVSDNEVILSEVKTFLLSYLPYYMIPTSYMRLDFIPTTPNGKIDKLSLPKPKIGIVDSLKCNVNSVKYRNQTDQKLLDIWRTIFENDSIGIDDNFFELGGDSLRIIQFQSSLIKYDIHLNTQDIYKYQTIRELSDMIILNEAKKYEGNNSCNHINLLESNIVDCNEIEYEKSDSNILLLGATGYLGIHLLKELIQNTKSNIYCIIRGDSKEVAEQRLRELFIYYFNGNLINEINERIFVINGDITETRFNLPLNEYNGLSRVIKIVVNSAALVKHYGFYDNFYKANVKSTENIIEFCLKSKSILHHMSTMSIFDSYLVNINDSYKFTENDFYITQSSHENVYIRSKIESEQMIFHNVTKGLKAAIYRIGVLSGRYSDGVFQKNIEENALYQKIKSIIQLGIIPKSSSDIGIELTPVDYCSSAIEKIMSIKIDKCKVYHLYNNNLITINSMIKAIAAYGFKIKPIEDINFAKEIRNIPLSEPNNVLSGIVNDFNNGFLQNERNFEVDSKFTLEKLARLDFNWPTISNSYIKKMLNFMEDMNFLDKTRENVDAQDKEMY